MLMTHESPKNHPLADNPLSEPPSLSPSVSSGTFERRRILKRRTAPPTAEEIAKVESFSAASFEVPDGPGLNESCQSREWESLAKAPKAPKAFFDDDDEYGDLNGSKAFGGSMQPTRTVTPPKRLSDAAPPLGISTATTAVPKQPSAENLEESTQSAWNRSATLPYMDEDQQAKFFGTSQQTSATPPVHTSSIVPAPGNAALRKASTKSLASDSSCGLTTGNPSSATYSLGTSQTQ